MNFSQNASKQQKGIVLAVCGILWRKTLYVNIYHQKQLFKQIPNVFYSLLMKKA